MTDPADQLAIVADVATHLRAIGLAPVLIGGMALVILGSRRVTQDFDFLVPHPADRRRRLIDVFYDRAFELVSKVDKDGNVRTTIDNRAVADARLRLDDPATAYFHHATSGLRIDLLFDFPKPAHEIRARAARIRIRGHLFTVAADDDLLQLKRIALAARGSAADAQDIAFLESRLTP